MTIVHCYNSNCEDCDIEGVCMKKEIQIGYCNENRQE